MNRRALVQVANRPTNLVGTDRFGNSWFAETRTDGTQVWAQVRENIIINGGLNPAPQDLQWQPAGRSSDERR